VEAGADPNAPLAVPVAPAVLDAFEQSWFLTQLRHDSGLTPLMLAAVLGDEEMVRAFLAHGGRPYQRTRRYTTDAVSLACHAGQIRTAQCLLRRDPDDESSQKLVVVLGEQRVTLFRGDDVVLTSKVSTGRKGYATPPGDYLITSKHRDWTSTIYKAPMPYLLRLNASAIGLHQGVVPGYPASHGCIRLPAGKAADFFKTARVGDRVLIRH
jgi:L,D-transpeptidase catalytic domain/Ankyrin repeat